MKIKLNEQDSQLFKLPLGATVQVYGHTCTMTEEGIVAEVDGELARVELESGRFSSVYAISAQGGNPADAPANEASAAEDAISYVSNPQRTRKELVNFAYRYCDGMVIPANMTKEQIVEAILDKLRQRVG